MIARAVRHGPLFAPGTGWSYSNTNHLLAGLVIEAVTHRAASSEIQRRILAPLGLKDTSFPLTDPDIHGPHPHGYDLSGRDVTRFSPSYDWTAGAMISTVDDLAASEPVVAWEADGGGRFTSASLISADGERQLVLAVNVYDLGADLRGDPPVPRGAGRLAAQRAALCG